MTYEERLNKIMHDNRYLQLGLSIRTEIRNNQDGKWELNSKYGNVWTFTTHRADFSMTREVLAEHVYHRLVESAMIDGVLKIKAREEMSNNEEI